MHQDCCVTKLVNSSGLVSSCQQAGQNDAAPAYDQNCDNFWMLSGSPVGRMGYIISFTTNEDRSVCINVGPHTGMSGPSFGVGLGGLFE